MNIEKLIKFRKDYVTILKNNEHDSLIQKHNNLIQEFADSIHPEKYITKQIILKLIERDKQNKKTNLENIKDEDKIIAYMFIEKTLGLHINVCEKVIPLLKEFIYSGEEIFKRIYLNIGVKYQPLIFNIYDEINNFHNKLSDFSNKYPCFIWTHAHFGTKHLRVYEPGHVSSEHYMQFDYDNIDKLVADLPRLDKKLEEWFEFRKKMYKEERKYKELVKELEKDPFFAEKEGIHDIQYKFYFWSNLSNIRIIDYAIYLYQKYHEKQEYFINIKQTIHFENDEYISNLDSIKINDLIDTIKLTNGKPYECEVTIEDLPTISIANSSTIQDITDKDIFNNNRGNLYILAKQIDSNVFLDITDKYIINQSDDQGHGRIGIVMSVFYFDPDFDVHKFIAELKNLYYRNISVCETDHPSNITIKDLGQSNKEFVRLI